MESLLHVTQQASTLVLIAWTVHNKVADILNHTTSTRKAHAILPRPLRAHLPANSLHDGQAIQPAQHLESSPLEVLPIVKVCFGDLLAPSTTSDFEKT